jgi:hypothetical protein
VRACVSACLCVFVYSLMIILFDLVYYSCVYSAFQHSTPFACTRNMSARS